MILEHKFRKENNDVEYYNVNVDGKQMDVMLKCILIVRGYNKKIAEKDEEIILSNGQSIIIINEKYNYIVNEYFENDNIISNGLLIPSYVGDYGAFFRPPMKRCLGLSVSEVQHKCNSWEFFRQAFSYNNKVATISFVIKMERRAPHRYAYEVPTVFLSMIVSYYDSFNVEFLNFNTDSLNQFDNKLLDELVSQDSKGYIYPDDTDTIPVETYRCNYFLRGLNPRAFYNNIDDDKTINKIVKALDVAYKKVEEYLGTELEKRDTLNSKIKRRIRKK